MPIDTQSPRDPDLVTLGEAVRRARRERGVSQEGLAHLAGLGRAYMSRVERGTQNAGVLTYLRLARALNMTMTELAAEAEL